MEPTGALRARALKVSRWLVSKGREIEAVELLCAWASKGASDSTGHELLAEALRIQPASLVAKATFASMEGVSYDEALLSAVANKYDEETLAKLEKEGRPAFRQAQVGFNNNVKHKGHVYHVQTEDSGLDRPHVITHLFADGGRIIKSHKRSYAAFRDSEDVVTVVRTLMKEQQMEMVAMLRAGRFDDILAGRAQGGLEELFEPPRTEVQQLATKKEKRVEAQESLRPPPSKRSRPPSEAPPSLQKPTLFRLVVLRSLGGGPQEYGVTGDTAIIGRKGLVTLPGERFCHPREAALYYRNGRVWLEDFEAGNGVFLRIRSPIEIDAGDEFVVGDELLRVERNPKVNDAPGEGPTYFYSSPKWVSSFRVVQIFEGGAPGATVLARGTTLQIGATVGDFVFPGDPLVSEPHCVVEEQAGSIVLTDLGSRTGVFVRIKGEQELTDGDELLVGRTRLVLSVPVQGA